MKIWNPKTKEYKVADYENLENIVGNNKNFYSKIKTGIGWFNDDCTKIIIDEYENLVDIMFDNIPVIDSLNF